MSSQSQTYQISALSDIHSFAPPFEDISKNKRRRTFVHMYKKPGVYLIKENGNIVYIGMSGSNVLEACYRHFYYWADQREYANRVTYFELLNKNSYEISILETSKQDAYSLERALIICMNPRDNREKYEFYINRIIQEKKGTNQFKEEDDLPF